MQEQPKKTTLIRVFNMKLSEFEEHNELVGWCEHDMETSPECSYIIPKNVKSQPFDWILWEEGKTSLGD